MLNNTLLMINYYLESLFCCCERQYNRTNGRYYKYGKTYRYQSLKKIFN